ARPAAAPAPPPVAIAGAPGGGWVYVDENTDEVEVIDVGRLLHGLPVIPPPPVPIGPATEGIAITATGQRLYVPFAGDAPGSGGVAILDISDAHCGAALHEVRACPDCGAAQCLV